MSKLDKFGKKVVSTALFLAPSFVLGGMFRGLKEDFSDMDSKEYNPLEKNIDRKTIVKVDASNVNVESPHFHLENYENELVSLLGHMDYQSLPGNSFSIYKSQELSPEQLNEISFNFTSSSQVKFLYAAQAVMDEVIRVTSSPRYDKHLVGMSNDIINASKDSFSREVKFKDTTINHIVGFEERHKELIQDMKQHIYLDNKKPKQKKLESYLGGKINDKITEEKGVFIERSSRFVDGLDFTPYTKNKNRSLANDVGAVVEALGTQYDGLSLIGKSIVDRTKGLAKEYDDLVVGNKVKMSYGLKNSKI
ncbi:hypothetical protein K9L67_02155 [Candidatus Woesearchaeota archaeon]|nr:hypothetical protein [Candidatus Woesearchaeota archaeon]MCF7901007.1 hypothetical protein [Candidatus Woesearchaeota archaeon]MCF8013277.1 hypothetical protein [Candidatus Woesearchaeota archaeon]